MNILPFVTIFILVISLIISSFFQGYKEVSISKLGFTGLVSAYRLARNASEDAQFDSYKKTLPKTKKPPGEKKAPPPKAKKALKKSFREKITDNSKLNFTPFTKEDSPFLEEIFANFLTELYANTTLFNDYKYDKKALPKLLTKALLSSAKTATSFETIILPDPYLHALWYKMLKGSPCYPEENGWPPLSHFVLFREDKEILVARKASIPLLKAFFGKELTQAILNKEQEPDRTHYQITKDELKPLLENHHFPQEYAHYIGYGTKAIPRKTESQKDPDTGITAEVSYTIKSSKSSCEKSSPHQESK